MQMHDDGNAYMLGTIPTESEVKHVYLESLELYNLTMHKL